MGFQYEGKTYAGTFKHAEPVNSCTECHDPHSLHTQSVTGSDANLCSTCHSDVKSYQDYKKISMSKVDYDGDGTAESTYDEIEGMRAVLSKRSLVIPPPNPARLSASTRLLTRMPSSTPMPTAP